MEKEPWEIIAHNLPTFLDKPQSRMPTLHDLKEASLRIIAALRAEGFAIKKED